MADLSQKAGRFQERAEILELLLEVAAATAETLDLDRLLANVAEIVKDVIPFELFAILLYSEKLPGLRIRYAIGHREELVRNLVVPLGEGLTGVAAASRAPVMVGDVRNDPRYLSSLDAVRAELAVPMVTRGKLVGVIDVQSTRQNAYTEQDRALLMLIASRISVAIDNARLYRRVERQNRTLKTLANLSQEFSSILEFDELLKRIAKRMRSLINYDAFSLLLVDQDRKALRHRFSQRYDQRVELDNIPLGKGITGAAVESREPVRVFDTSADPRYISSHPGIRSEVAVPLIVKDRVVGVMDLESERVGYFTDDHVRMLTLLSPQVAASVENARLYEELGIRERRMETDLKAARKLQSVLLPRVAPEITGLEIATGLRPAHEISGDIYDFFEHGDEYALIACGDVSGKGAAAALYGALVSGFLRTLAPRRRGPAMLLQSLNDALLERRVDATYVTLIVMLWQAQNGRFTMANAGAIPPIVCRKGELLRPRVEGVPAGLLEGTEYDEIDFQTQPGDTILLYSDGVQDQFSPNEEEYGKKRLPQFLRMVYEQPAQAIVDAIFQDLDRFTEGAGAFDDQTLVVMKVI
jgi:sigma-B regulation protein RsbU (phosphoserine phosphatase)